MAGQLVEIGKTCGFPSRLRDAGVIESDLRKLAKEAGRQWTGTFNPRPFGVSEAMEVYECAY